MRGLYNFISYVFFPGTLAVVGFWSIFIFEGKTPGLDLLWFPALMFLLAPVLVLLGFLKMGWVSDLHVSLRKERAASYSIALVFALLFVVITRGESWAYWHWGVAVFLSLFGLFIVNIFWMKASAHMAGVGGYLLLTLLAYAKGESLNWFFVAVAVAALVYIARKGLSAHTHIELIAGFATGFLAGFVAFRF